MKPTFIIILAALWLVACQHIEEDSTDSAGRKLHLPNWTFLAKASATVAEGRTQIPKRAYIFPAMRLNASGQIIDQLAHRVQTDGTLSWYSAAPLGSELQLIAKRQLTKQGFTVIPFNTLTTSPTDHSVTVFNLYYTEANPSRDNPNAAPEASWTTFCRITAATFPNDLNPNAKQDLMHQELVSLFNGKRTGTSVTKHSVPYLLKHIGETRQWSDQINLLY